MELDAKNVFIVHYDGHPRFVSDVRSEAEAVLKEKLAEKPQGLPWKISVLEDFGYEQWSEGKDEGFGDGVDASVDNPNDP